MSASSKYTLLEKMKVFLIFSVGYSIFYIFPNLYANWEPTMLPLSWLDKAVPFLPWTFLIYTSDYLLIGLTILIISDRKSFNSFGRMMFFALVLCGMFFLLFPTIYPRPPYPILDSMMIQIAMDLVYIADSPKNCFPSMHVALTTISAWSLRNQSRSIFFVFLFWTFAVIVSTMTTKQHYFVDILGGLSVVVAVVMIEKKWVPNALKRISGLRKNIETSKFTNVF